MNENEIKERKDEEECVCTRVDQYNIGSQHKDFFFLIMIENVSKEEEAKRARAMCEMIIRQCQVYKNEIRTENVKVISSFERFFQ